MKTAVARDRFSSPALKTVILVFVVLLLARILGLISVYFLEGDEVSLATGAAAMVKGTAGYFYRYTVQLGYYRLTELLTLLTGGHVEAIPWIDKGLSALSGTVIPVAAFFAFKKELLPRERWLVLLTLAINPVIWRSSQYGNTAILSAAFSTVAFVIWSNRPTWRNELIALVLTGLAILVRADAVLLVPLVFAFIWTQSSPARAVRLTAGFGAAMLLVYVALIWLDPHADNPLRSVSKHMLSTPNPTMFWEFLLWAMSPFPLILAVLGMRSLADSRPKLLVILLIWCLPTLLFYFRATTTVRYFMNVAVPLSIAAAIGMNEIGTRLTQWMKERFAWGLVIGVATIHLFIALGRVMSNAPLEIFYGGTFTTHDGPMPTGALLVRTYLTPGSLARSLPRPRFATQSYPFWEGVSFTKAVNVIKDPNRPPRTVVVLLGDGFGHAFHYHLHVAGARYSNGPTRDYLWESELWLQLGNARVMTIGPGSPAYDNLAKFDVKAGDEIWVLGRRPFPEPADQAKLPAGINVQPTKSFDSHFQAFNVVAELAAQ